MILFVHRPTYIRVIRLDSVGKRSDNLGKIFRISKGATTGTIGRTEWMWAGCYRNNTIGYETLNGSEKRQIIGLLDNLNGIDYRPQCELSDRWDKIVCV